MAMGCPHQGRSGGLNATITSRPFDSPRPSPGGYVIPRVERIDDFEPELIGRARLDDASTHVLHVGGEPVSGKPAEAARCSWSQ